LRVLNALYFVHQPNSRFNSDVNASHCRRLTLALGFSQTRASSIRKTTMRYVACYIALAIVTALLLRFLGPYSNYARLSQSGASAQATVVEPICWDHGSFIYTFEVNKQIFKGRDHSNVIGRVCQDLRINEKINITFWPPDPSVHTAGSPSVELTREESSIQSEALIFPLFGIFFFIAYQRNAKEQANAKPR